MELSKNRLAILAGVLALVALAFLAYSSQSSDLQTNILDADKGSDVASEGMITPETFADRADSYEYVLHEDGSLTLR